jgi:hypothetical protein
VTPVTTFESVYAGVVVVASCEYGPPLVVARFTS